MAQDLGAAVKRLTVGVVAVIAPIISAVPAERRGTFSVESAARVVARRAASEYLSWAKCRGIELDTFFEAVERATARCYLSAAESPKVDVVQVAAYRRLFEASQKGRAWFRAALWEELDRMLIEGLERLQSPWMAS